MRRSPLLLLAFCALGVCSLRADMTIYAGSEDRVQFALDWGQLRQDSDGQRGVAASATAIVAPTWGLQSMGATYDGRMYVNTKRENIFGYVNDKLRWRNLETDTFFTRDPLGFIDGPNYYTYVHQNPATFFDPLGLYTDVGYRTDEKNAESAYKKDKAQLDEDEKKLSEEQRKSFDYQGKANALSQKRDERIANDEEKRGVLEETAKRAKELGATDAEIAALDDGAGPGREGASPGEQMFDSVNSVQAMAFAVSMMDGGMEIKGAKVAGEAVVKEIGATVSRFGGEAKAGIKAAAESIEVAAKDAAQMKKLSPGEIKKLQDAGHDIHDLKGEKNSSLRDLFKDNKGDVYVKPKNGTGPGDPTGINVNDP